MVIWRALDSCNGSCKVYKYFMWPYREYARFEKVENIRRFHVLMGEFARIAARKGDVLPKRSTSRRRQHRSATSSSTPVESANDSALNQTSRNNQIIRHDGDVHWTAVTPNACLQMSSYEIAHHFTAEEAHYLMELKKRPKEPLWYEQPSCSSNQESSSEEDER